MEFRQFVETDMNGLDADDIVARLPSMTFAQQADIDKRLHDTAINNGTFGAASQLLAQDKTVKTAFQRILAGDHDKNLVRSTIFKIQRDQEGHKRYLTAPQTEKTGNIKWHLTWIHIYDNWLKYLRPLAK